MKEDNVVQVKSYAFALRVVKLYKYLKESKNELDISRQLLRSGTSIGANIEEALGDRSDRNFLSKMNIAYKEARETHYWIRLLADSQYLLPNQKDSLLRDCNELLRIIGAIQVSMKTKLN